MKLRQRARLLKRKPRSRIVTASIVPIKVKLSRALALFLQSRVKAD